MKILHSADWHIGKKLYREDLQVDHTCFFHWLVNYIKTNEVAVLLLSGDVFDQANPSAEARKQYYEVLVALTKVNCQVIITGGNHDSPAVLNAPRTLLQAMQITVVGGMPADILDCLIPINNIQGKPACVVAAIPYLRDADLRQAGAGIEERVDAIRQGIAHVFAKAAEGCAEKYPNIPAIAMGHLFAHGVSTSDSEREVQVGNLAGFEARQFPEYFSYIALGHIHKPQVVAEQERIQYSGSPIPLSFSEREDHKQLILIDITDGKTVIQTVPVPQFRKLWRIKGSLNQLQQTLTDFSGTETELPVLVELLMVEEQFNPEKIVLLEDFIQRFSHPQLLIIKHRVEFVNQLQGAHQLYENTRLDELNPSDVFSKRLETEELDARQQENLTKAFATILEEIEQ